MEQTESNYKRFLQGTCKYLTRCGSLVKLSEENGILKGEITLLGKDGMFREVEMVYYLDYNDNGCAFDEKTPKPCYDLMEYFPIQGEYSIKKRTSNDPIRPDRPAI